MFSFLQNLISQGLAGAFTQDPNGNQAHQRSHHLRTLENLDADVASVISEEIFSWVGTESKGRSSNHFGIREPEEDMRAVNKTNDSGIFDSCLQEDATNLDYVACPASHPLGFRSSFILNPSNEQSELGILREKSTFPHEVQDDESIALTAHLASKLNSIGHPRLPYNRHIRKDLWEDWTLGSVERRELAKEIVNFARSLILEQCVNLREITFSSEMSFVFYISRGLPLVLSERLTSIKTYPMKYWDGERNEIEIPTLSGKQVVALLMFLPELKTACLDLKFGAGDAKVINSHLPELLKSNRAGSKVTKLCMRIHLFMTMDRKSKGYFDGDSTFQNLLSLFKNLENLSLDFFDHNKSKKPKSELTVFEKLKFPSFKILEGLTPSAHSLTSLSIVGFAEMEQMSDSTVSSEELNSMVKRLKNLTHLRCENPLIVKLAAEQKMSGWESSTECYLPAKLQSLELPYNFECRPNPSNLDQFIMTPSEQMLHMILEYTSLPKSLKVIKTVTQAKLPADQFEELPPEFKDSVEGKRWAQAREELKRVVKKKNLKLELIEEKDDDWF